VNLAYNRERFDEAHDVIVKAWTTPGPFRWARMSHDAAIRGIDLMTREVMPAVKAYRPARREKVKVTG
jgi:hypothetical protein